MSSIAPEDGAKPSSSGGSSSSTSATNLKPAPPAVVRVGVGVLVVEACRPSHVLIGRRKGSHGSGYLALPGGHLEVNETIASCAVREVEEECGLALDHTSVRLVGATQDMHQEGKHYVTLFVLGSILASSAPLENREPHKCEGWVWEDVAGLARKKEECFLPLRHALETFLVPEVLKGQRTFTLNESLI